MADKVDNILYFPGYYISPEGVVYSRYDKRGRLSSEYKPLKIYTRSNGYQQIVLKIRKQGKLRRAYIHRLVAETYIPNPLNLPCVCHKDNNRTNNKVDNLYWGSYEDNTKQAMEEGRLSKKPSLRALIFSDLHICDYAKFNTRLDTAIEILNLIASRCMEEKVPAIHLGDLFHKSESQSTYLINYLQKAFKELNQYDWTLYSISGNHCCPHANRVGNKPTSWVKLYSNWYPWLKCIDFDRIHIKNLYLYGVPYLDHNIGLNDYIKNLHLVNTKRNKHILLLHTDYPGARDTDGVEVGTVENLNTNLLSKFDLTLIGHIHKPQRLGKKIYMVGAPYQQRRTDKNCEMGYWELYSDCSMKFINLSDKFPKFIDVETEDDIKEDGNYYTVVGAKIKLEEEKPHKITKALSKKRLVKRYLKARGIADEQKKEVLLRVLKEADNDNI